LTLLPKSGKVLDIGCGNGRNSAFMKKKGYQVTAVDMAVDFGSHIMLGRDPFPKGKYDIILANYVLMFLDEEERKQVIGEIQDKSKEGTVLVVELYEAKDAYPCNVSEVTEGLEGWEKLRFAKAGGKCILRKL